MIIELSDFFNNPSLISLGPLNIQYYAVTWVLSAYFIYLFLKTHPITKELALSVDQVNDLVFLYGLIFGAMIGGRIGYMFFYGTDQLVNDPLSLFYIWQGGSWQKTLRRLFRSRSGPCRKPQLPKYLVSLQLG